MPKLWSSYEEFSRNVNPTVIVPGVYADACIQSAAERERDYKEAFDVIEEFVLNVAKPSCAKEPDDVDRLNVIFALEHITLLDQRLMSYRSINDALTAKNAFSFYRDRADTLKLRRATDKLVDRISRALCDIKDQQDIDRRFLIQDLQELPDDLRNDFIVARDLFSIGVDEFGLFAAARGLERVLRKIWGSVPFGGDRNRMDDEQAFAALISNLYKQNFEGTDKPILNRETKTLLEHVNQLRNACAHGRDNSDHIVENAREHAQVIARSTRDIWRRYIKSEIPNNSPEDSHRIT